MRRNCNFITAVHVLFSPAELSISAEHFIISSGCPGPASKVLEALHLHLWCDAGTQGACVWMDLSLLAALIDIQ
jgi:hypothetical protein